MKLLIDTDIGDDIDDVLALGLAFKLNLEVVGITTVYREAKKRRDGVLDVLRVANRADIPVFSGYSKPMLSTKRWGRFQYGKPESDEWDEDDEGAVDFMIDCAEKYGEELLLLAIGPQTNVARAIQKNPTAMNKVGRLVMMGGCFFIHNTEWNIMLDSEAARIVMESDMNKEYVGFDQTYLVGIGKDNYDYIERYEGEGLSAFIADMVVSWHKNSRYFPILHDPLALLYCVNPDTVEMKEVRSLVAVGGVFDGFTCNIDDWVGFDARDRKINKIKVACSVDAPKIVSSFMKILFEKDA